MTTHPLALRRLRTAERLTRRRAPLARLRARLEDGALTTLHVASYDRVAFQARVVALARPQQLAAWCGEHGVRHAIVGGFFLRPLYVPLGEVRLAGAVQPSIAVRAPWSDVRACVALDGDSVAIVRRHELPAEPAGDLLQAGPLLVREGRPAFIEGEDLEGFSAGADQFDSDITQGRYPRAALAVTPTRLLAVACDGRTEADAGMTLGELAAVLIELGATEAINLDGGGSSSLVHNGRLRNRPREEHGVDLLGGRPIVTAIVFEIR
jgi:hypothetical protein